MADSSVNTEDRGYLYDAAWNLSKRTNNGVVKSFSVDVLNQLTRAPGKYSYDANGNMTERDEPGLGFVYTFTYDDENRLISIVDGASAFRRDFVYDGLGRVRSKQEYTWNGSAWSLSTQTNCIYDGMRVIQERLDSSNTPTVSYTRGSDLSGSLEGAGGIGGLLARSHGYSSGNWTTHNYYFADGGGNITYMTDNGQSMVAKYRYDPFGNTITKSGTLADVNLYRFSSKEIHPSSGMYYYGYRFYEPYLQRWLNRDPLAEYGGINLYAFAENCPLGWIDVDGRSDVGLAPSPVSVPRPVTPLRPGPLKPIGPGPVLGPISVAIQVGALGVYVIDSCYPPASPDPLPFPVGPPVVTFPAMGGGNPIPTSITGPRPCYLKKSRPRPKCEQREELCLLRRKTAQGCEYDCDDNGFSFFPFNDGAGGCLEVFTHRYDPSEREE